MYSDFTQKVIAGMKAAGLKVIRTARMHNTNLVIWRDGPVVEITPDEADAMVKEREAKKDKE